jgi:hypothetical protein
MLRFTAWLARSGTIAANSLKPYFSAINKFFRDHPKEPVALGPLIADARRGLAIQQQPITAPDIRVPLPAPIVQHMLLFAHRHYRALTWQPDNLVHIKTFRAMLAVCTNYCYFCRAKTGVRCHMDDIAVDRTGGNILLFVRKAKGDQRRIRLGIDGIVDILQAHFATFLGKFRIRGLRKPHDMRRYCPDDIIDP